MRRHMKLHSDGTQECKTCGKTFAHRRALRSHQEIHKAPRHVCSLCGKGFHKKSKLMVILSLS